MSLIFPKLYHRQLDSEALVAAIRALEALAHERTITKWKQESDELTTAFNTSSAGDGTFTLPYDPASVFLLETMVSITCQTSRYIEELWQVSSSSSKIISNLYLGRFYLSIYRHYYRHLRTIVFCLLSVRLLRCFGCVSFLLKRQVTYFCIGLCS
jgi:hypothetical protein